MVMVVNKNHAAIACFHALNSFRFLSTVQRLLIHSLHKHIRDHMTDTSVELLRDMVAEMVQMDC